MWFGHDQPVLCMSALRACKICGAVQAVRSRRDRINASQTWPGCTGVEPDAAGDNGGSHLLQLQRSRLTVAMTARVWRNSSPAAAGGRLVISSQRELTAYRKAMAVGRKRGSYPQVGRRLIRCQTDGRRRAVASWQNPCRGASPPPGPPHAGTVLTVVTVRGEQRATDAMVALVAAQCRPLA